MGSQQGISSSPGKNPQGSKNINKHVLILINKRSNHEKINIIEAKVSKHGFTAWYFCRCYMVYWHFNAQIWFLIQDLLRKCKNRTFSSKGFKQEKTPHQTSFIWDLATTVLTILLSSPIFLWYLQCFTHSRYEFRMPPCRYFLSKDFLFFVNQWHRSTLISSTTLFFSGTAFAWKHSKIQSGVRKTLQIPLKTVSEMKNQMTPLVYKQKKVLAYNSSAWRHSKFQSGVRKTLQMPLKTVSEMKNQMTPLVYKQKKVLAYNSSAWRHSKFQSGVRKPLQIKEKHSIVG